jgi:hypothetical protein
MSVGLDGWCGAPSGLSRPGFSTPRHNHISHNDIRSGSPPECVARFVLSVMVITKLGIPVPREAP